MLFYLLLLVLSNKILFSFFVMYKYVSKWVTMYWLRWHYHVKDIAGAPYKIRKKSKQKNRIADSQ